MSARTLLTFEEFEQYHDDGMKHELLKGEHIVVPPPKSRHTRIQQKILDLLRPYVLERRPGEVYIQVEFLPSSNTWLQPNVSFIRTAQIQRTDPNGYCEGAPALAIEVVSESNTEAQLDLKMELYFAHDGEEVWIVDPKMRSIRLHRPDGTSRTIEGGDLQTELLPGWSVTTDSVFED